MGWDRVPWWEGDSSVRRQVPNGSALATPGVLRVTLRGVGVVTSTEGVGTGVPVSGLETQDGDQSPPWSVMVTGSWDSHTFYVVSTTLFDGPRPRFPSDDS